MKINILSKEIFTQISAGEVVENPKSIVKELLENSIDAGATSIAVYIEEGGLKSITVIDNGFGIESTEIEKAFLPHATSKISSSEDLMSIGTLGFRGEALASISAVSEVSLSTKHVSDNIGTKVIYKGGELIEKSPSEIEKGTKITVTNLFYNTPARFKFLKSQKSEESLITQAVAGLILANPTICISYYIDSKLKFHTSELSLFGATETVFQSGFTDNSIHIENRDEEIFIEGYISAPGFTKGNKSSQYLIINGRSVVDPQISSVVQNAYGERLMTREFPMFCISINMPIENVDVNVHPNKLEVRLSEPRKIHGLIYHAVKNGLEINDTKKSIAYINALSEEKSDKSNKTDIIEQEFVNNEYKQVESKINNLLSQTQFFNTYSNQESTKISDEQLENDKIFVASSNNYIENNSFSSNYDFIIVGQIFDTYLILELADEIFLIDQHAAHERIRYDELIKEFDEGTPKSQTMLLPYTMYLDEVDLSILREKRELLNSIGFDIDVDDEKIILKAIPSMIIDANLNDLMIEIIAELKDADDFKLSKTFKHKIATAACRSAIKGGDHLTNKQIESFIEFYKQSGAPLRCPHGRPTIVKISKTEIEKLFKRII